MSSVYTGINPHAQLQRDIEKYCASTVKVLPSKVSLSRAGLVKNINTFAARWPYRTYQVLAVARRGSVIETQIYYECYGEGRETSGYTLFRTEVDSSGRIVAIGEKTSKNAPPSFSPGMSVVTYNGQCVF